MEDMSRNILWVALCRTPVSRKYLNKAIHQTDVVEEFDNGDRIHHENIPAYGR